MASSPYRFNIAPEQRDPAMVARSRVGLSGIGSGAASGGEGYRLSALRPGSTGFMAASFGDAPRTDYVKPTPATAETPAPTLAPAITSPPVGLPEGDANFNQSFGEGRGAGSGNVGGPESLDNGGKPGDLPDLGFDIDGKTVGGVLGGLAGGLLAGPAGALVGGIAGRALGGSLGGGAAAGGDKGDIGGGKGAAAGSANSGFGGGDAGAAAGAQGDLGGGKGTGDPGNMNGFARGGRVTGDRLMQNRPKPGGPGFNKPKGFDQGNNAPKPPGVSGFGNKPKGLDGMGDYMGGFADGGSTGGDPNATDIELARSQATRQWNTQPIFRPAPGGGAGAWDDRMNYNNADAGIMAMTAERWPGLRMPDPNAVRQLIQSRPDLVQAIIEQQGSVHPVNPASPSTGYQGAYAGGGRVGGMPHYMDGGQVNDLAGPDPAGPDDGYAALDQGEYVVNQQQAQRPDYAPILEEMNEGTYQPGQPPATSGSGAGMMPNGMPSDAGAGAASALPDPMQQALGAALQSDPMVAAALTELLGVETVQELIMHSGGGMGGGLASDGRPPLSGPPPVPGMASPPGVRPPNQPQPVPMAMGGM